MSANIIRVPQDYAANTVYSRVKEAAQTIGEECIALEMYHVNEDEGVQPRCSCYNDVYAQSDTYTCPLCYGTTFQGGVKHVWRIWSIFDNDELGEKLSSQGVWQKESHSVQMEPFPVLTERDFLLRVKQWNTSIGAPVILGKFYELSQVNPITIRTGNRYGGSNQDRIAQKAKAALLPDDHPIYQYAVTLNAEFARSDGNIR